MTNRKLGNICKEFISEVTNAPMSMISLTRKSTGWSTEVSAYEENIIMHYDGFTFNSLGDKMFRADFVRRCPMAKNYADVTLTILHEIGHNATKIAFLKGYKRYAKAQKNLQKSLLTPEERNRRYFRLKGERIATDWAINWLQSTEHQAIAKKFENKFFQSM